MLFARGLALLIFLSSTVSAAAIPEPDDNDAEAKKYFHEPGNSDLTGHYDIRYFDHVVDYETRLDTLKHMVRAWLNMTEKEGIETWIAHGTLLGWWWNAKLLPWDWDLDVQMHSDTLLHLGNEYNMTMHNYESEDGKVNRMYLLDVNPWSRQRTRGDGMNIIDARWIDVRNGLFIDITGIAETDPEKKPGILQCKNFHAYSYDDIWPLRDALFEGVPAKIPYNFDKVLIEEYNSKALTVTEYEGHRWNHKTQTWDFDASVPSGKEGEDLLKRPRIPGRYSTIDTGGVFHNLFRLVHWW